MRESNLIEEVCRRVKLRRRHAAAGRQLGQQIIPQGVMLGRRGQRLERGQAELRPGTPRRPGGRPSALLLHQLCRHATKVRPRRLGHHFAPSP